jgi:glycosyltransferase involved in cell wall biosynthesis
MSRIVMMVENSTFARRFVPLIKFLQEDRVENEVIPLVSTSFGRDNGAMQLEKEGIPFKLIDEREIYQKVKDKIRFDKKKLWQGWQNIRGEEFSSSSRYKGISIWKLLSGEIMNHFVQTIFKARVMEYVLECEKPEIVVTNDDKRYLSLYAVSLAKNKGIPTLCISYGDEPFPWRYRPHIADKTAVFGEYTKKNLIKGGVPPEKIVITGCPTNDLIFELKQTGCKDKICKALSINSNKKIILFSARRVNRLNSNKAIIEAVAKITQEFRDTHFIIKLRNEEREDYIREVKAYIARRVQEGTVLADYNILELMFICDLFISEGSTTIYEALAFDKPIMLISIGDEYRRYKEYFFEDAVVAKKEEEIYHLAKQLLLNPNYKKLPRERLERILFDHMYKIDGCVRRRLADLIYEMIERGV